MKILLLGEYSNVHATLAEGLRLLGHEVTVASNGDFWKDYPRDIDLSRHEGKLGGLRLLARVYSLLPRFRDYDIVQLINPMFLELRAERLFSIYRYLRRHNRRVVMGAFGMDWYWIDACVRRRILRYSDFNIGDTIRMDDVAMRDRKDWEGTTKERLNKLIAHDCDAIATCLYEYQATYEPLFPEKTRYIPLPIKMPEHSEPRTEHLPIRIFVGISKGRSVYKGTDIMLRAAEDLAASYPDRVQLIKVEGAPFNVYQRLMDSSDLILDQLYSYTPSMNPLLAMSKGIICVGGGEPENYEILNEQELRPIINVQPNYESVYYELERIINNVSRLPLLSMESIEYVRRHHDYMKVARQYEELYKNIL